jgi:hypothetical protein
MVVACSTQDGNKSGTKILVRKPEGKRQLSMLKRRWEDNTAVDLREVGFMHVDWIHLTQATVHWPAVVKTAINFQVS